MAGCTRQQLCPKLVMILQSLLCRQHPIPEEGSPSSCAMTLTMLTTSGDHGKLCTMRIAPWNLSARRRATVMVNCNKQECCCCMFWCSLADASSDCRNLHTEQEIFYVLLCQRRVCCCCYCLGCCVMIRHVEGILLQCSSCCPDCNTMVTTTLQDRMATTTLVIYTSTSMFQTSDLCGQASSTWRGMLSECMPPYIRPLDL